MNALQRQPLPIYGRGLNVRDWLYVEDHARALLTIITRGAIGETYNVGGNNEMRNLDVVEAICDLVDEMAPERGSAPPPPGHLRRGPSGTRSALRDRRFEADARAGWAPSETFSTGLRKTVEWYVANRTWWDKLRQRYDGRRLGLNAPRATG